MSVLSAIAKVMKDVMNIEGLRTKLAKVVPLEEEKTEVEQAEEEGWTLVAPGKVVRRHHSKATESTSQYTEQSGVGMVVEDIEDWEATENTTQKRDGIPINPLEQ